VCRHHAIVAAIAIVANLPAPARADDRPLVRIESVAGSRLVGTLKVKTISVQADFGRVEVDPSKLKSVTLGDQDGDTIVTTAGSIIKGKIADEVFEIESEFGTLKLDRAKLKSITLAGDEPPRDPKARESNRERKPGEARPETRREPKDKPDEGRAPRPSPIPRFLTRPSALNVTTLSAGRPPTSVRPPPRPSLPPRHR